jgi:hypothetical protein
MTTHEDYVTYSAADGGRFGALPDGWTLAVWADGHALLCSPRACARELGGRAVALESVEAALADLPRVLREMGEAPEER